MGRWSREELESAFAEHERRVVAIGTSWDWPSYADEFTEDAHYVEHAMGTFQGREHIRDWITTTMNTFPGSEMPWFPTTWHAIDQEKGWVFSEVLNRMRDPGDGSIHEAANITILKYAGDGLWSYEEDAYNAMNFMAMLKGYIERCVGLGTASDDALTFAKNMGWEFSSVRG
jgi:hypothetical protein